MATINREIAVPPNTRLPTRLFDPAGYAHWQKALERLAKMSEDELGRVGIAQLSMFCAGGLPGTQGIDPDACLVTLDRWADHIQRNIEYWWPDFLKAPQEGEDSPGKFRMMAIATLLQRKFGVRYNVSFAEGEYDGRDSRNLFLQGLLTGYGGTCVTMPILYVAIGRRLGYPLYIAEAPDHNFARWDEPGVERFNIECTCQGFKSPSDDDLCRRPKPIPQAQVRRAGFLRNLTHRDEFALMLNERGNCLLDHLWMGEALEAYWHAYHISPRLPGVFANWVVASIISRTLIAGQRAADAKQTRTIKIEELEYPKPDCVEEARAIPIARKELARILRIHGRPDGVESAR